jgi:tRNA(fMet)-specific endonuclease VapC
VNGSVVVDTTVFVEILRKGSLKSQLMQFNNLFVPLVVFAELQYGACKSARADKNRIAIKELLKTATILLPDTVTAMKFAETKAIMASRGDVIPDNDIWIGTAALEERVPVATQDKHFTLIPGLTVLLW